MNDTRPEGIKSCYTFQYKEHTSLAVRKFMISLCNVIWHWLIESSCDIPEQIWNIVPLGLCFRELAVEYSDNRVFTGLTLCCTFSSDPRWRSDRKCCFETLWQYITRNHTVDVKPDVDQVPFGCNESRTWILCHVRHQ